MQHAELVQVHGHLRDRHQNQQSDEEVIAAIAGFHEGDRQRDGGGQRKRGIHDGRGPAEWREHENTAGHPQRAQGGERQARGRGKVAPVVPGGEQKAHPDHYRRQPTSLHRLA